MPLMFRIGEFSRFSRVSVKMLRHYDDLGLLTPAYVDPQTSYRYYSAAQLPRLHRIVALKDIGFSLEQIGLMLDGEPSSEQVKGMLKLKRAELQQQMREVSLQLAQTQARLAQLERDLALSPYDVVLRSVGAQRVASIRHMAMAGDDSVPALFEELEAYVAQFQARAPLPPLMLYHDSEFLEEAENVEIMVPLEKAVPPQGRVTVRELAGHDRMACLIHTGHYEGLSEALAVLLGWIETYRFAIDGPTREIYLRFGADQKRYSLPKGYLARQGAEFVTELQIPVCRAPA